MRRFLLGALVLAVLFAMADWSAMAASKGDAKSGQAIFTSNPCATCHGKDGSANTPMGKNLKAKDLRSDEVQKMTDDELAGIIAKGKNKMPSYEKTLGAAKIQDLVAYVRSLKTK